MEGKTRKEMTNKMKRFPIPQTLLSGNPPIYGQYKEWGNSHKFLNEKVVADFVHNNPKVLHDFMYESTDLEILEQLLVLKKKNKVTKKVLQPKPQSALPKSAILPFSSTNDMAATILENIDGKLSTLKIIEQTCSTLKKAIKAKNFQIFVSENGALFQFFDGSMLRNSIEAPEIQEAIEKKKTILVTPSEAKLNASSMIILPLILPSGSIKAVLKFSRKEPFLQKELQLAHAHTGWISACIAKNKTRQEMAVQKQLMDYFLVMTKELFEGLVDAEAIVPQIMRFTKSLVKADRCSFFLVDLENDELYAEYFDEGAQSSMGIPMFTKKDKIRFPKFKGIAGSVAKTGKLVNIRDAYKDSRFNTDVDKLTGYRTKNILCVPVIKNGQVIGVIQMINSLVNDYFSRADEQVLKQFSSFCAMALHYSHLYFSISTHYNMYRVCMEILEYHCVCKPEELKPYLTGPYILEEKIPVSFVGLNFINTQLHLPKLPNFFFKMVVDLFGDNAFDPEKLMKFILTVRKNYRVIPYHHWEHGFEVAHTIWRVLKLHRDMFTEIEIKALIFAGICHDIDHRGYNNDFFVKLNFPLASLYSTSVMEQHHYKQTVMILNTPGLDVFSSMSADEYKELLQLMRTCIIATDLVVYYKNKPRLEATVKSGKFRFDEKDIRTTALEVLMTGSDLISSAKPWKNQKNSTCNLYKEFYHQGDVEKKHGFSVSCMMDRDYESEVPRQQVNFFQLIVIPLYTLLSAIYPHMGPLVQAVQSNHKNWSQMCQSQSSFHFPDGSDDSDEELIPDMDKIMV